MCAEGIHARTVWRRLTRCPPPRAAHLRARRTNAHLHVRHGLVDFDVHWVRPPRTLVQLPVVAHTEFYIAAARSRTVFGFGGESLSVAQVCLCVSVPVPVPVFVYVCASMYAVYVWDFVCACVCVHVCVAAVRAAPPMRAGSLSVCCCGAVGDGSALVCRKGARIWCACAAAAAAATADDALNFSRACCGAAGPQRWG